MTKEESQIIKLKFFTALFGMVAALITLIVLFFTMCNPKEKGELLEGDSLTFESVHNEASTTEYSELYIDMSSNNEELAQEIIVSPLGASPSPTRKRLTTFKIWPRNEELEESLKSYGFEYHHASDLKIVFAFSGEIRQVSQNLFNYTGGVLIVQIGDIQHPIQEAIIEPSFPIGNSLNKVEQDLKILMNDAINSHVSEISSLIRNYLE